jgi:raffinose/stachyose/melibiose transport system substrate-binding protein
MMISSHLTRRAVLAGGTAIVGLAAVKANAAPRRVVWWYEGATAAQQAALEQSLVKPFNASQSEYELVIEFRGSGLPDQLLVALSAGSGPDIILTNGPAWTQRMVIAKRLLPLNDLAKKFEWDKRIVPFMLGMGTYDGTMYALPKTTETQVLFYNDTLFKKNGWTPPTDRAAFEALADKMIKAGVQPLAAGNAGARYVNRHYVGASFSCCAGPDSVYNALSGKLPWNDPVFVESIQLLKNWWDKGYFGGPKYFALSGQQSFALMAIGKSGMAIQGSWAFQWVDESFKKTGQDLNWTPIPKLSARAPYPVFPLGIGADLAINAASQVPEGAAKVMNALLDHKFIIAMSEAWGVEWDCPLVSPPKPADNLDRTTALAVKLNYETTSALQNKTYGYAPWTFWPARTDDYMKGGMEEVWLGQITAKQFCDKVDEVFQQDLKDGLVKTLPARA